MNFLPYYLVLHGHSEFYLVQTGHLPKGLFKLLEKSVVDREGMTKDDWKNFWEFHEKYVFFYNLFSTNKEYADAGKADLIIKAVSKCFYRSRPMPREIFEQIEAREQQSHPQTMIEPPIPRTPEHPYCPECGAKSCKHTSMVPSLESGFKYCVRCGLKLFPPRRGIISEFPFILPSIDPDESTFFNDQKRLSKKIGLEPLTTILPSAAEKRKLEEDKHEVWVQDCIGCGAWWCYSFAACVWYELHECLGRKIGSEETA